MTKTASGADLKVTASPSVATHSQSPMKRADPSEASLKLSPSKANQLDDPAKLSKAVDSFERKLALISEFKSQVFAKINARTPTHDKDQAQYESADQSPMHSEVKPQSGA